MFDPVLALFSLTLGLRFRDVNISAGGAVTPGIRLSGTGAQDENTAINTAIGTLSVVGGTGTYTFTKTVDGDSAFNLAAGVLKNAFAWDYETKTSHDVTIHADNGAGSTFDRTFTIFVNNVLEVTLVNITLSASNFQEHSVATTVIGSIIGKTAGSTLVLTNDGGGRVAISGSNLVVGATDSSHSVTPTFSITFRETHPDATNTPHDTTLTITVDAAPVTYVPTYLYFGF